MQLRGAMRFPHHDMASFRTRSRQIAA